MTGVGGMQREAANENLSLWKLGASLRSPGLGLPGRGQTTKRNWEKIWNVRNPLLGPFLTLTKAETCCSSKAYKWLAWARQKLAWISNGLVESFQPNDIASGFNCLFHKYFVSLFRLGEMLEWSWALVRYKFKCCLHSSLIGSVGCSWFSCISDVCCSPLNSTTFYQTQRYPLFTTTPFSLSQPLWVITSFLF